MKAAALLNPDYSISRPFSTPTVKSQTREVGSFLPVRFPSADSLLETYSHHRCRLRHDRQMGHRGSRLTAAAAPRAVLGSRTTTEGYGLKEPEFRNPAVSTEYRSPELPRPNQTVLDAQARVCTGPTQTRPLSEEQAVKVLDTILKSGKDEM